MSNRKLVVAALAIAGVVGAVELTRRPALHRAVRKTIREALEAADLTALNERLGIYRDPAEKLAAPDEGDWWSHYGQDEDLEDDEDPEDDEEDEQLADTEAFEHYLTAMEEAQHEGGRRGAPGKVVSTSPGKPTSRVEIPQFFKDLDIDPDTYEMLKSIGVADFLEEAAKEEAAAEKDEVRSRKIASDALASYLEGLASSPELRGTVRRAARRQANVQKAEAATRLVMAAALAAPTAGEAKISKTPPSAGLVVGTPEPGPAPVRKSRTSRALPSAGLVVGTPEPGPAPVRKSRARKAPPAP
jgi:hypothetical protein